MFSGWKDDGNAVEDSTSKAPAESVLELSLTYDTKHSTLIVSVEAIRRLQALVDATAQGRGSVVSPYVRLQVLLPDGRRLKAKTRVVSAAYGSTSNDQADWPVLVYATETGRSVRHAQLYAATLSRDKVARQNRAIKLHA